MSALRVFVIGLIAIFALTMTACTAPVEPVPDTPQITPTPVTTTLIGTWIVSETYNSPDQPFLAFDDDGTWTGSDGCNKASGTWALDATTGLLTTTSAPQTRIYCDGAQLPFFLTDAKTGRFDGTDLVLVGHDGSTLATLHQRGVMETPAASGTNEVVGTWTAVEIGRDRLLVLHMQDDGTVQGNDGCNDFSTTWRFAEDGSVSFSKLDLTQRTCDGVVTWLSGAASAVLDGTTMVIRSQYGGQLGILTFQGTS